MFVLFSLDRKLSFLNSCFSLVFFFFEVWLIYNVMLITAVQQSDSVLYTHTHTHTHTHSFFKIVFSIEILHKLLLLCKAECTECRIFRICFWPFQELMVKRDVGRVYEL